VEFAGRHFEIHGVRVVPPPVQRGGPPVFLGARAEVAVRRAARLGCGIVGADAAAAALYLSAWREEGHDPANARIALQVEGSLDGDRLRALTAALAAAGRLDLLVPGSADPAALARIAALRSAPSWGGG
jgi:alkanesulfonate monooxygenase SsuD/methylene tetrahydromethanopterin reductase-like flavin-dependent oxidoreductase (luciferase family)